MKNKPYYIDTVDVVPGISDFKIVVRYRHLLTNLRIFFDKELKNYSKVDEDISFSTVKIKTTLNGKV